MKDKIIVLKNNKKYIVVNEEMIDNKLYSLAMGVTPDEGNITSEIVLLERTNDETGSYVQVISDESILERIVPILKSHLK